MILPEALVSVLVGPSCGAKSCRFCGGAWSLEHIVRLLCPLCRWGFVMFTWSPSRICHVSGQAACYGQFVSLPAANFLTASQTVIAGLVSWAAVSVVLLCSFIVGCAHSSSLQCSLVGIRPIPIPMSRVSTTHVLCLDTTHVLFLPIHLRPSPHPLFSLGGIPL